MFRFWQIEVNIRSETGRRTKVRALENKRTFRRDSLKSDEGAAGEIVHNSSDDRIGSDSFEQGRAAGDDGHANDQDGANHGDHLLDTLLAAADPGDMLADTRAAVRAYAAALDDQVTSALGAFDFGSQRHRGYEEDATSYRITWQVPLCTWVGRC